MGSVSQSTRGVFFWLLLLCVVVDVHTAVEVTARSQFSAHVRRHTIGVTIDRSVFFCLLLVCVVVNFGYPICVIGTSGCGVFPRWFVMPCYAHGQVASVVCYAVLCHGRVECLYKKGTLICRGSTRVYPVESL